MAFTTKAKTVLFLKIDDTNQLGRDPSVIVSILMLSQIVLHVSETYDVPIGKISVVRIHWP